MPFYGSQSWDPKLICAQIVALQSASYITLGLFLAFFHQLFGTLIDLNQFFSYSAVDLATSNGWVVVMCTMLNSLICAGALMLVVERAKKCLDFAFTTHLIHLCLCSLYDSFPSTWEWWIVNALSLIIMAVLGEYLCMRRELREIRISDFLSLRTASTNV
mmetsp:Transcript_5519/g.6980  ORF Transcript_5519/g.6980 Transcript_5519/m.6980 type:complete len:160 (+) Transcript_5519:253-732(+)